MKMMKIGFMVFIALTFATSSAFAQGQATQPAAPPAASPPAGEKGKEMKAEKTHAIVTEGEVTGINKAAKEIMITDKSDNKTPVKVSDRMLGKVKLGDTVKVWLKPDSVTAKNIKVIKKSPKEKKE